MAASPAALAASSLAADDVVEGGGVIRPDRQVSGSALVDALDQHGIRIERLDS
jgi:hypothetical protein